MVVAFAPQQTLKAIVETLACIAVQGACVVVGACVVDSGYDGEVFVNIHNIGRETQSIEPKTKIAQAVMIPVVHFRALETTSEPYDWYPITISERGDGALGSTDEVKNEKA